MTRTKTIDNLKIQDARLNIMSRIHERIMARYLSQAEAAELLGIAKPRISEICNGRGEFSIGALLCYAETLGLNLELRVVNKKAA